jgi:hypothetical protein
MVEASRGKEEMAGSGMLKGRTSGFQATSSSL